MLIFLQDEFAGDGVDLYDDVIAAPPSTGAGGDESSQAAHTPGPPIQNSDGHSPSNANPPYHQMGNNIQPNQVGRRHQLYVGNLTWVSVMCGQHKLLRCGYENLLLLKTLLHSQFFLREVANIKQTG
jgi:hypothetical protein